MAGAIDTSERCPIVPLQELRKELLEPVGVGITQDLPRTVAAFDTMTPMIATRQPISPQAAARYQERWSIASKRLNEELRATSMETKLRQLAKLMQSAREMGWSQSLDEEDDAVRAMWMAIRRTRLGKA